MVGLWRVELPTNGLGNLCPSLVGTITIRLSWSDSQENSSCFGMPSKEAGESSSSLAKNGGLHSPSERIASETIAVEQFKIAIGTNFLPCATFHPLQRPYGNIAVR